MATGSARRQANMHLFPYHLDDLAGQVLLDHVLAVLAAIHAKDCAAQRARVVDPVLPRGRGGGWMAWRDS